VSDGCTRRLRIALVACLLAPVVAAAEPASATACRAMTGAQRGALVELYTSEGCSSCPPADRWFAQIASSADPQQLSLLAFHVDYWDDIGWADRFGSGAFSDRQRARVAHAGDRSVYTPQVMVGQRVGFPWGTSATPAALHALNAQPSPFAMELEATPGTNGYEVALKAVPIAGAALPGGELFLALYENGLSTQVKAGENRGVLLHHERVVRRLLGPYPLVGAGWSRSLHVSAPRDAHGERLGLTAFVQSDRGDTLQALSLPLASCAR
jgi:hypothetical protein